MKNALLIIVAVFLSIFFVLAAFVGVISAAFVSLVDADRIASYVEMVDYEDIIEENDDLQHMLNEYNVDDEIVKDVLESDALKDVVGMYSMQISDLIRGNEVEELSVEHIKDIVKDNIEEITEIANDHLNKDITEEKLENNILKAIDDNADEIMNVVPSPDEIRNEVGHTEMDIINAVFDPHVPVIILVMAAVFLTLVFICRIRNAHGFIWASVDCFIAFLLLGIFTGIAYAYLNPFILDSYIGVTSFIGVTFDSAMSSLGLGIGILAILTILFLVLYFLFRNKILPDNHTYVEVGVYNK